MSPRRVTGEQLVGDGEEIALRLRNGAQEGGASGVVGEVGGDVARGRAAAVVGAGEGVSAWWLRGKQSARGSVLQASRDLRVHSSESVLKSCWRG